MLNWANSTTLGKKSQVFRPLNEEELIHRLKATEYECVKVLGSGMSFLGIGAVPGEKSLLLDLSMLYNGCVDIDGDRVTYGSQTVLEDITKHLISLDKQLSTSPGVLLTQTLAGALATGTHGQGFRNGGFSDIITKVRVILADGSIKIFNQEDEEFDAFRIHLGALGIITHVTIQCEPFKVYRLQKGVTDYEDMLENFEHWNQTNLACKAWWFPKTNHVQLWKTFDATQEQVEKYNANSARMYLLPNEEVVENNNFTKGLEDMMEQLDIDTKGNGDIIKDENATDYSDSESADSLPNLINSDGESIHSGSDTTEYDPLNAPKARFKTVIRFKSLEGCIGNLYELWCKGIPAPQVNCEIAVPMSRYKDALRKLHNYYKESGKDVHYPFILRATGQSPAYLSPSYNEPVCYIGFLVYLAENDYSANGDRLQFLKEIESLLSEFDSIPHYGKFYTVENYDLHARLPKFKKFVEIREQLDPRGVFMNEYLKKLLCQ